MGLVFQYPEYQLFEETVYDDIAFGPKNMGLSGDELKDRVLEICDLVGVKREFLEESPFDLSGGEKRRVAIAGVMAMRPEIIITDELSENDCIALRKATSAGIKVLASAHFSDISYVTAPFFGVFDHYVLLDENRLGKIRNIYDKDRQEIKT